uniref:Uncharacterized protein n=1 Tax=Schistocephalus solidus TaxID=70667 RepID=A0A0X3QC82_SCHSO
MYKAATSVEGYFVCIGWAVNVGFVPLVLLSEQIADDCVAVIEPVLVLTTCAVEHMQGGELHCVPQLSQSVLHGGILVGVRNVSQPLSQFVAEMEMVSMHIHRNTKNINVNSKITLPSLCGLS